MIEFQVEGMSCQHCASAVTKAIQAHDATARVQVDLERGRVVIESGQAASVLQAAIDDAGYTVKGTIGGGNA
ncbi:heavy-metal-associated domain-containing protein [Trinickia terrae]|uniref:Heavy-metal-associated domain-containing protein n=1 Tax=Trinickia terrae TaxID=2571161 RepID=A0A4U1H9B3_9BURK|nr:heavy-metal-associated domain-containing protein [Trinickia terrae]TKC77281.1 heavy-metal-associated domain-containing protein [Trinickia terrae]